MNVTELSRRFNIRTEELLNILPEFGFDIGRKAIKVDERIAFNIIKEWPRIQRELMRRREAVEKKRREEEREMRKAQVKEVLIPDVITVREYALALGLPVSTLMRELVKSGILASLNDRIDFDTASILAEDLGFTVRRVEMNQVSTISEDQENALKTAFEMSTEEELQTRPPVIVVMGHVDHGKTKLLDALRSSNIISTEAGGITQHIGAYQLNKNGKLLTFIDTPGHVAFTVMRSRGARVADIAILVVAADDGVMPQTKEAIQIIHAAKLPFVVAMNKMDKAEANPEKLKSQLSEAGVQIEEWGGEVPLVPISAKAGTNIDTLLDVLLLLAEAHKDKIRANPHRKAIGTIIDARVDKGEGPVATILIQAGTLRSRDPLVVNGKLYGRVRAMRDYLGMEVREALPGMPVKILGFNSAPEVGDILDVAASETAESIKKTKSVKSLTFAMRQEHADTSQENGDTQEKKLLPVLIKADTLGSLEAIVQSLEALQHREVGVHLVSRGLGNITDVDVEKAEGAGTLLYAFHVHTPPAVVALANSKKITIRSFDVIYDLLNDVRKELEKLLPQEVSTKVYGSASVVKIFRIEKRKQIVGCRMDSGLFVPGISAKIIRAGEVLGEGKIVRLKAGKSEVKEVRMGTEFGMELNSRTTVVEGDVIEGFVVEKKERKIHFL